MAPTLKRKRTKSYAFEALAERLLERIKSGEWPVGTRLPTVDQLTCQYPESRVTMNKALQVLEKRGLLSIRRGRGIYVEQVNPQQAFGLLIGPSLVASRQSPFAAVLAKSAKSLFDERGQSLKIYVEDPKLLYEGVPNLELREDLQSRSLSGLIMAHCNAPKTMELSPIWQKHRIPAVDFSGEQSISYQVSINGIRTMELAFAYAAYKRRKSMALFSITNNRLFDTARDLSAKYGIAISHDWNHGPATSLSEESGFVNTLALWQQRARPEALMIFDDTVAKGAVQAMLKLGISHPDDLLIIASVNKDADVFFPMPFIRIELDARKMVAAAIELLEQQLADPQLPSKHILVQPQLRLENGEPWDIEQ